MHSRNTIAYISGNLSYFDIWTMNPDGGDKKQLTTGAMINDFDWNPDGSKIAFDMMDVVNGVNRRRING